jgi:hypothetical protein
VVVIVWKTVVVDGCGTSEDGALFVNWVSLTLEEILDETTIYLVVNGVIVLSVVMKTTGVVVGHDEIVDPINGFFGSFVITWVVLRKILVDAGESVEGRVEEIFGITLACMLLLLSVVGKTTVERIGEIIVVGAFDDVWVAALENVCKSVDRLGKLSLVEGARIVGKFDVLGNENGSFDVLRSGVVVATKSNVGKTVKEIGAVWETVDETTGALIVVVVVIADVGRRLVRRRLLLVRLLRIHRNCFGWTKFMDKRFSFNPSSWLTSSKFFDVKSRLFIPCWPNKNEKYIN